MIYSDTLSSSYIPWKKLILVPQIGCFPSVGFDGRNKGIYFRGTRQLMSKIKGNRGLINSINTDLRKIQTPENTEKNI